MKEKYLYIILMYIELVVVMKCDIGYDDYVNGEVCAL